MYVLTSSLHGCPAAVALLEMVARNISGLQGTQTVHFCWPPRARIQLVARFFGRNIWLGFKQQQQDLVYSHSCLRKKIGRASKCCSWFAQVVSQVALHARCPEFKPRACPINILYNTSPLSPPLPLLWLSAPHPICPPPTALSTQPCTFPNFCLPQSRVSSALVFSQSYSHTHLTNWLE
jgi:hypothetical protein